MSYLVYLMVLTILLLKVEGFEFQNQSSTHKSNMNLIEIDRFQFCRRRDLGLPWSIFHRTVKSQLALLLQVSAAGQLLKIRFL